MGNNRIAVVRPIGVVVLALLLAVLLMYRDDIVKASDESMYVWSSVIGVATITAVGFAAPLKLWSGGFFLVLLIGLFHLGLPVVLATNSEIPSRYVGYLPLWLNEYTPVQEALWLCMVALTAFALAYVAVSGRRRNTTFLMEAPKRTAGLALGGLVLVLFGASMYLGAVVLTAPELLTGAGKRVYDETVAGSTPIAYGTIIVSIGSVMAAAAAKSRPRTVALIAFFGFTLITLGFGSRTAALYSLVSVFVVMARIQKMPKQRVAAIAVIAGLLLVSAVQQFRDEGLSNASAAEFVGSPVSAAAEMGLTLRPVIETVGWVQAGEPLHNGTTYLAGIERIFESTVGIPRPPSDQDPRFAGTLARQRVDLFQIGYSIVAEAYLNFGPYGLPVFFAALGILMGTWDRRGLGDALSAARYGVVFVALIAHVRQASNITLTSIILGMIAVEIVHRFGLLQLGATGKSRVYPENSMAIPGNNR